MNEPDAAVISVDGGEGDGPKAPEDIHRRADPRRALSVLLDARYATVFFLVGIFIFFAILNGPRFYEAANINNILGQSAILGIIAAGLTVPLIVGQFDVSIGWHASFAAVLAANLAVSNGTAVAFLIVLGVSLLVGVINGIVVTKLHVSAIIATLGMGAILVGGSQWVASTQLFGLPSSFSWIGQEKFFGVPVMAILMLVLGGILWLVTTQTPWGRELHASGDNEEASRLAGLRVDRIVFITFVVSALAAGLSGLLLASRLASATFGVGDGLLLDAFTACAIGMVTFRRSQYNVLGTILAVVLLTTLVSGMTMAGWPAYWQSVAKGVILIGAVALASRRFGGGRRGLAAALNLGGRT